MYKKILISLSAIIIFSLPYQQQYAESAILSKVATKGAQKIVKEIIQDAAVETAIDFVLNEKYKIPFDEQNKYQKQAEYELFCGKKMPDLVTCEKPMQVKAQLTETDKANIKSQSGLELEKLITGGKGLTRWQKFLDWFLPIWAVSFALTAITYALDDDVRQLFNEAGYNALVALGIIKPVSQVNTTTIPPLEDVPFADTSKAENVDNVNVYTKATTGSATLYQETLNINVKPNRNYYLKSDFGNPNNDVIFMRQHVNNDDPNNLIWYWDLASKTFVVGRVHFDITPQILVSVNDGEPISLVVQGGSYALRTYIMPDSIATHLQKTQSVVTRSPMLKDGYYYTDVIYRLTTGDVVKLQLKTTYVEVEHDYIYAKHQINFAAATQKTVRFSAFMNQVMSPPKILELPVYDSEEVSTNYGKSNYENEEEKITMVPPSALPYTKTSTGEPLEPKKVGDGIIFTTPDGTEVPEDDITVGEPDITKTPEGLPQYNAPPTTSNPSPSPTPLTPPVTGTPPTSPPKTTPPVETNEPIFPEGESCDVGLKLPKFMPLLHTISDAFPFSIPFDLKDGFDAIFAEMGSEKPEFDYKLNVMGEEHSWKITIPDYFDAWKSFTDSFLIFIFDVGIIYAIYRFMGGGN